MAEFSEAGVLRGLKGFQRDAVDHVFDRFYGTSPGPRSGRFLVADETGLGKSIVARGVIARAIAHLQNVDDVDRIDIVYMCSNADLARQNLARLNVTGETTVPLTTRLSLLALELPRLRAAADAAGKKVNLVSFTPGTSGFSVTGEPAGTARERSLLAILLREILVMDEAQWAATLRLFQRRVTNLENFRRRVRDVAGELGQRDGTDRPDVDAQTTSAFAKAIRGDLLDEFRSILAQASAPEADDETFQRLWHPTGNVLGRLRRALAKASLQELEPDLIILDEFQRFRDLLLPPEASEAAELADDLFSYPDARVLLLSATPYKPYTRADEDEDHYRDFMQTVSFLAGHDAPAVERVRTALHRYRTELVAGGDSVAAAADVRDALLPLMSRSERPQPKDSFAERRLAAAAPTASDIAEYARLRDFGDAIGAPVDLDYWKSIPYFANFMDGYKASERARLMFKDGEGTEELELLQRTRHLDRASIDSQRPLDLGNGYLRTTNDDTLATGWSSLLWVPPSMPYLAPAGVFAEQRSMTKRVVFSAWSGVPTAVSSLLSYEADRLAGTPPTRRGEDGSILSATTLLNYSEDPGDTGSLSTLALFFPMPPLASLGDPLRIARLSRDAELSAAAARTEVAATLAARPRTAQPWDAFFSTPYDTPSGLRASVVAALGDLGTADGADPSGLMGLQRHIDSAARRMNGADGPTTHDELARFALHAPGMIAYRSVMRIADRDASEEAVWTAAFRLANGLRSLFNRPEAVAVLRRAYGERGDGEQYWSAVLRYCADGNLQAVLDEYLHQLASERGGLDIDDRGLLEIAAHAADVLGLRVVNYVAHDTDRERTRISMKARFALRYGNRSAGTDEESEARQADVRSAFNSPFAPFVLVSTSVGQEGIDFHWWSHAVVHWNLPSNPVDFEQREGRVNRYAGHAIRRNVAAAHWANVLVSDARNPWDAAFAAAAKSDVARAFPEFAPWWIYPGEARIQRIIMEYPLSSDGPRYEAMQKSLALYRLTLGQPRQEDMVALMQQQGVDGDAVARIDLRPPRSAGEYESSTTDTVGRRPQ